MDRWMSPRFVVVLAALVATLALAACGNDDDGGGDAKGSNASGAQGSDGGGTNAADGGAGGNGGAGDGAGSGAGGNASSGDTEPINLKPVSLTPAERQRLQARAPKVRPYTGYGFDRGLKKDKVALMSIFRKMQRQFYAGDAMGFCRNFGTDLYSLPDLQSGDSQQRIKECAAIVSRTAKGVANGRIRWPFGGVQWVRVYRDPGVNPFGGITVRTSGREVRLGFERRDGRWLPAFRVPKDLRTLSAA